MFIAVMAVVFTCAEVVAFFSTTRKTHLYNFSGVNTFAIYVIPILNCTNLVTTPLD